MKRRHSMPFGAEPSGGGRIRFRLWAPSAKEVELCLVDPDRALPMSRLDDGWFELITAEAAAGTRYKFRIDGSQQVPDPASRRQPEDVHGPSQVCDPEAFEWNDENWRSRAWEETVFYELHVGTLTLEGTFAAAAKKLDYLADLGVTAIELMPVADFPGTRNWGYDGVFPFAPDGSYGHPDDLKRLVEAAHQKELMVFLDVVYNHFGPDGNYLRAYAPQFFTSRHHTPWGEAINFDGAQSRPVRDFFIHNALYWLEEFHFDGLRLDAVQAIVDDSNPDILTELAETVREKFGAERCIHLVLENDNNAAHYLASRGRTCPKLFNAQWNDDIHHTFHVLITGENGGYYSDYAERPLWQLGRSLTEGFAYQGEISRYRNGVCRGEPSKLLPASAFVAFLQNHDQIGNRAMGERITKLAPHDALRAAISILLLAPSPPLIFMGDEFGSETPFLFFCDFDGDLARAVTQGRRAEFARFLDAEARAVVPDPNSVTTFRSSKLVWSSQQQPAHAEWLRLYHDLLSIRRETIVPLLRGNERNDAAFEIFGERGLRAWWQFGTSKLKLVANLSHSLLPQENRPAGQVLFTVNDNGARAQQNELPAWSATWVLEP